MAGWDNGGVIVLNGTSSVGKTALLHDLKIRLPLPTIGISLDDFLPMCSWRVHDGGPKGFRYVEDPTSGTVTIGAGEAGEALLRAMHRAVGAMWFPGIFVVVDDLRLFDRWSESWKTAAAQAPLAFIALHCPDELLDHRERTRGDRKPGLARAHARVAHAGIDYDLEIDPSQMSVDEETELIAEHLGITVDPRATPFT